MGAYLQVWRDGAPVMIPIEGEKAVMGRDAQNEVPLGEDPTASRVHAVIERQSAGWSIRDLGSANGTFVNGRQLAAEMVLRTGDEVKVGATQMLFRTAPGAGGTDYERTIPVTDAPPMVTRRERDVLIALCKPVVGPGHFTQPASVAEIAEALVVSRAAVSFHLDNLYAKFGIDSGTRRAALANAALSSGAVSRSELRGAT